MLEKIIKNLGTCSKFNREHVLIYFDVTIKIFNVQLFFLIFIFIFKMDFYDSKAAVDAMAALQARIKDLEMGNAKLRKEAAKLRILADEDESRLQEREMSLLQASEKAQKMLEGASETLVELRRIRKENRSLQRELDDLQAQLNDKLETEKKSESVLNALERRKQNSKKLIAEYEALFKEILTPPALEIERVNGIVFNNTVTSSTYSLPAMLQTVVQDLQTLPFPFRTQKLEKKREILTTLLKARDIAARIADEIHELEMKKKDIGTMRRIQAEIDVKAAHYYVITNAMARFRFE